MASNDDELARLLERVREQEEELEEARRLAVIGASMRGLAHSIRGAQGLCLAATHMVERALRRDDREEFERAWGMVKRSLSRTAELCAGLLDPEKAGRLQPRVGDPDVVVAEVCEMAAVQAADQGDSLEMSLSGALDGVCFDNLALRRCCIELTANALDALAEIQTPGRVVVSTERRDDGWCLEVEDTGPGMSPELLDLVTHGRHTTKGRGGTGLGLLQVRELVRQHGGRVEISSGKGRGTTVLCWFPMEKSRGSHGRC